MIKIAHSKRFKLIYLISSHTKQIDYNGILISFKVKNQPATLQRAVHVYNSTILFTTALFGSEYISPVN